MKTTRLLLTSLAAFLAAASAFAATYIWDPANASGNFSDATKWLVDGATPATAPGAGDDVIIAGTGTETYSMRNVTLDVDVDVNSLLLSDGGMLIGDWKKITANKLILGNGFTKLVCSNKSVFQSFDSFGTPAVMEVSPNTFSIIDKSKVRLVNGIAIQFAEKSNNGGPGEFMKFDGDKLVVVTESECVTDDIMNTGANGVAYLTTATTLTGDTTVNGIRFKSNVSLDLGGHTLTVKSGFRPARSGNWVYGYSITNGTVKTEAPMLVIDRGSEGKLTVNWDTSWNTDPLKRVLDYSRDWCSQAVSPFNYSPQFVTGISGIMFAKDKISLNKMAAGVADDWILETGPFEWTAGYFSDHGKFGNIGGIAGKAYVKSQDKFNSKLWLGTYSDETWNNYECVVGPGGVLVPGGPDMYGNRKGCMTFPDLGQNLKAYQKLIFKPGSKIYTTVRSDGSSTYIQCPGTSSYRCKVTIEGGEIAVIDPDKALSGTWTVLNTTDQIEGVFDTIPSGYTINYNVEQQDGSYSVQLVKEAKENYDDSITATLGEPAYDQDAGTVSIGYTIDSIGERASSVSARIEWGTTQALGNSANIEGAFDAGDSIGYTFNNVSVGDTIYFRVTLSSAYADSALGIQSVSMPYAPLAATYGDAAYDKGNAKVVLSGTLIGLGGPDPASIIVDYGSTQSLGSSTVALQKSVPGDFEILVSGLAAGDTIYYRFRLTGNGDTVTSAIYSFVIPASCTVDSVEVTPVNAQLGFVIDLSNGGLGTLVFRYYVGQTAGSVQLVHTVSTNAVAGTYAYAYTADFVGDAFYRVEVENTYNGETWTQTFRNTAPMPLTDASTYTWKGGKGAWADSAMWTTTDAGAAGVPSAGSSVVIGDADSSIELSSSPTVANLTLSSVGRHEFRSTWMTSLRTLTVNGTVTFTGAGGGTLVFDSVEPKTDFIDLGGIRHLVIGNYGSVAVKHDAAGANGDFSGTAVTFVDGGTLAIKGYNNKVFSFGKLTAIGGPCVINLPQAYAVKANFSSFEAKDGSGLPVVTVPSGIVSFTDMTGIEMVGGTDTLEAPGPQIPVCTQFQLGTVKAPAYGCGACTLDGGTIKEIPASTMLDSFAGATALDNICVTNATTVSADVTVNAVLLGRANLDLDGHTVTVQSGVCREQYAGALWDRTMGSGTFRLARPSAFCDGTGNAAVHMHCDYATVDNTDPMKPMLAYNAADAAYPADARHDGFTGRFSMVLGKTFGLKSGIAATNAVLEMRGGTLTATDHNIRLAYRGLAGVSTWTHQKWYPFLYLGVPNDDDYWTNTTRKAMVVVGDKGILAPGVVDYDGARRGPIVLSYHDYLKELVFRDGGELHVALHADGTSSYVDLTETTSAGSYMGVTLDGALSVTMGGKVPLGVRYPVVKYQQGKLSGRFAHKTAGFKVEYDVPQPDGTYAVTVSKLASGTVITLR